MNFPELKRKLLMRTQKTMADPAIAANENNTAMSSPGFPRYFLHMSENSKTSPRFTRGINRVKLVNSLVLKGNILTVWQTLLKTSNGILPFLRFDWLTGNGIWARIPLTTNLVIIIKINIKYFYDSWYTSMKIAKELKFCNSLGVFNKTIIPLVLVGYEIVIANSALSTSLTI